MFVSIPAFEQHVPQGLAPADHKHWLAVMLSNQAPWFLLTHAIGNLTQTVAVAWESTLLSLVEMVGSQSVLSVRLMIPDASGAGSWAMKEVIEVWSPSDDERPMTGPALLRLAGDDVLRDSFLTELSSESSGRQLVFRTASGSGTSHGPLDAGV